MVQEDGGIENPALLSRSELQWLLGKSSASKTFQYKMLSNIRRKIQALVDIDLPLLMKNNLLSFELGRDLEPIMSPSDEAKLTEALVRQRSFDTGFLAGFEYRTPLSFRKVPICIHWLTVSK
jgi:hypothetical protein